MCKSDADLLAAAVNFTCQGRRESQRAKDQGDQPCLHGGVRERLSPEGARASVLPEKDELGHPTRCPGVQTPSEGEELRNGHEHCCMERLLHPVVPTENTYARNPVLS